MDLLFSSGSIVYTGSCFSGIYALQNHTTGKWYVGESIHVPDRVNDYIKGKSNIEYQILLNNAINKYGISDFSCYKLEQCNVEDLYEREVYWGTKFNSMAPNGYNLKVGGSGNSVVSDESRNRMSQSGKTKVFTEEHKKNIALGQKRSKNMKRNAGKKHSDETKLKMSKSRTGLKYKPMSEEGRRNISIARKAAFAAKKQQLTINKRMSRV